MTSVSCLDKVLDSNIISKPSRWAALGAVAGVGSIAICLWRLGKVSQDRFRRVPGLPLLGVALKLKDSTRLVETLEAWSGEYGSEGAFEFNLAGQHCIVCCSHDVGREVFALRPFKVTRARGILNNGLNLPGLFMVEGRQWSKQRRLISPAFNAMSVQSYLPLVHMIVENLIVELGNLAHEDKAVNVSVVMRCFDADLISKVAFNSDFGSLQKQSQELVDLTIFMGGFLKRMISPIPYWKAPWVGQWIDGADHTLANLEKALEKILEDPASTERSTVLKKLVEVTGEKLSHRELVANLVTLFVAGTDTSSHSLAWAFYELARHPTLQQAIASEAAARSPAGPGHGKADALPLAQAVWMETLRSHTVTPLVVLENLEAFTLAGRTVPPHTQLFMLMREMGRRSPEMQRALGEDWETFRPERFLAEDGSFVACASLESLIFGQGARSCPGRILANTVGPLVLSEVMRHFRIEEWRGAELGERTNMVQAPERDVELRFVKADDNMGC